MANYYGAARSNYFRVKNVATFLAAVETSGNRAEQHPQAPDCCILQGNDDGGGFNTTYEDDDGNQCELADLVQEHLADGSVAILMEAGAEKLCYLSAWATAITWDGRIISLALDDIYDRVVKELGIPRSHFATATYMDLPQDREPAPGEAASAAEA